MEPYHAVVHAARLMLGVLFVVSALEGLYFVATGVELFRWPMTAPSEAFVRALQSSGFFWPYLKGLEFIGGALLLSNRYVALGLALAHVSTQDGTSCDGPLESSVSQTGCAARPF